MAEQSTFEGDIKPLLRRFHDHAVGLTKSKLKADDLLQDTLLRAYERYHLYQDGTNLKAWIMRIMTNLYINGWHKERRKPTQVGLSTVREIVDDGDDVDARTRDNEVTLAVKQALLNLPELYRDVIMLVDIHEYTLANASIMLNMPVGTIKSKLHRGRPILQRTLLGLAQRKGIV